MDLLEDDAPVIEPLPRGGSRWSLLRRLGIPTLGALASGGLAWFFAGVLYPVAPEAPRNLPPERGGLEQIWDLRGFEDETLVEVPTIQVTLADDDHDGMARIQLVLAFRARDPDDIQDRVEKELAVQVRDALTMHISGKYASELRNVSGKELLKLELIDLLDSLLFPGLREGKVTAIYYQEFMIS